MNGLLFEEAFSPCPICVIELFNLITRRGEEDCRVNHFTYPVGIIYKGVGYAILNITDVIIIHTVVLLPHTLYNIKSQLLLELSTAMITNDLVTIGFSHNCLRKNPKVLFQQRSSVSQFLIRASIFTQVFLTLKNH